MFPGKGRPFRDASLPAVSVAEDADPIQGPETKHGTTENLLFWKKRTTGPEATVPAVFTVVPQHQNRAVGNGHVHRATSTHALLVQRTE